MVDLGKYDVVAEALRAAWASFALVFGSRARGDSIVIASLDDVTQLHDFVRQVSAWLLDH